MNHCNLNFHFLNETKVMIIQTPIIGNVTTLPPQFTQVYPSSCRKKYAWFFKKRMFPTIRVDNKHLLADNLKCYFNESY